MNGANHDSSGYLPTITSYGKYTKMEVFRCWGISDKMSPVSSISIVGFPTPFGTEDPYNLTLLS